MTMFMYLSVKKVYLMSENGELGKRLLMEVENKEMFITMVAVAVPQI